MSQPVQLRKQLISKNLKNLNNKVSFNNNSSSNNNSFVIHNSNQFSTSTTNITVDYSKDKKGEMIVNNKNNNISNNNNLKQNKCLLNLNKQNKIPNNNNENINSINTARTFNANNLSKKNNNNNINSINSNSKQKIEIEIENTLNVEHSERLTNTEISENTSNPECIKEENKNKIEINEINTNEDYFSIKNNNNFNYNTFNEKSLNNNVSLFSNNEKNTKDVINKISSSTINDKTKLNNSNNNNLKNDLISQNLINLKINYNQTKEFNKTNPNSSSLLSDLRKMESLFIRENHSKEILMSLLQDEKVTQNCLENHKINERMRMRMIDWMIEVVNNYKCDENVFFQSINLMDDYFFRCAETKTTLDPNELHLIGVCCMFTSSKFQDIYPLRLRMVYEKIAHKKLSMEEIKKKESEILTLCDFINISKPTIWDFINFFIEEIFVSYENRFHIESERVKSLVVDYNIVKQKVSNLFKDTINTNNSNTSSNNNNKLLTPNMVNLLKHVAIYLAKMNYHDYQLVVNKNPSLLAAATVFVSLKICEQINKVEYLTECFIKKLSVLCNKQEQEIIKIAQKILNNAQNFDNLFPNLENLKRVHFNAIIELKNTK